MAERLSASDLRNGMRASIRHNYTAYGFSVMITAAFGAIATILESPRLGEIFLFLTGAVGGFTIVEAIVSGGFRHGPRGERSDVVALGTAFSLVSVALGVGAAALVATAIETELGWLFAPFAATVVYVLSMGIEMAVAERIKKKQA